MAGPALVSRPTETDPAGRADAAPAGSADPPAPGGAWRARVATVSSDAWITAGAVVAVTLFTFIQLQPDLIFTNSTPAGGDMGAHVWAPAYLRDHLLGDFRLTGWTPDWYAGFPAFQFYMVLPSLAIVLLDVVLPYGIAFKLITIAGVVTLPLAAWAMGRLFRAPFPVPALLAVATLPFLFDRSFTIYGGNIASTLAGEFAFSISLSLAVLYLGLVARGLETGEYRGWAAITLALTGLTHLLPAFFALAGTAVLLAMRPRRSSLRWAAVVGPVAAALSAFWILPFYWNRTYLNDMGWVRIEEFVDNLVPTDSRWVLVLALVGAVGAVWRRDRLGLFLMGMVVMSGLGFVLAPQGRLWNARLLPFYYLALYFLAAVGVAYVGLMIADRLAGRSPPLVGPVRSLTAVFGLVGVLILVALPLRALPFGSTGSDGVYRWLGLSTTDRSFIDGWARWNYSGYEAKTGNDSGGGYTEYHDIVTTMAAVGETEGCGRAMWEYERELDRYGTPMALMLMPHWTDGCIGSMEGLYFEASATTPYHFLNQSELSAAPSRAQRGLPYSELDIERGVEHLQLMGVRYYMAFSDQALAVADEHPDLTQVAASGPWVVYEVADSELVEPVVFEPTVWDDVTDSGEDWLDPSVAFYQDPSQWEVLRASSGPDRWARVDAGTEPPRRAVAPILVSDIETGTDSIAFTVDEPGTPVLVKASYFPNWQVSGADGPYRVAPNLMVVVPTDNDVELTYGRSRVEILAWLLTAAGMATVVVVMRRDRAQRAGTGPIGSATSPASPTSSTS